MCCVWQEVPQHPVPDPGHSHPSVSGAVPLLQSKYPVLQVYEHVDPLQDGAVALLALHLSPHALQSCVVFSDEHVPSEHDVSAHVHAPFRQSGVGCAHVVWFVHVPVLLHVCVVLPLQFSCPGAHTPVQAPLTQVWLEHGVRLVHCPDVLHTCG